jgi:hypothetical protein
MGDNKTTVTLTPVPSHERDPSRCQATVLSSQGQQCSARATTKRDGHPCCSRHQRARWFVLWTPASLLSRLDSIRAYQRVIEDLRYGKRSPVRLVKS